MRYLAIIWVLFCISKVHATDYLGEAAKHIKNDIFTCPVTGLSFAVPNLNAGVLEVNFREANPGITFDLVFAEELGHLATVTWTKIRSEYPKTDEILQRTAANIKLEVVKERGFLEWCGFLSGDEGRVFQCVIRYPARGKEVQVRNKWLNGLEPGRLDVYILRHYLVRDGWLLEYNLYVPQQLPAGSFDEDKLIDQWSGALHEFVSKSSLVGPDDVYAAQLKAFRRPSTYFRFVFPDPARN